MNEYQRYFLEEFVDDYRERHMTRRELIRRATLIMGGAVPGMAALTALGCGGDDEDETDATATTAAATTAAATSTAMASTTATATTPAATATGTGTATSDAQTSDVRITGGAYERLGYLARPQAAGTYPGVVIVHENRGLNEHTKDIARRYAAEGFVALAVDLVSRDGGSKEDTAQNTASLGRNPVEELIADMGAYVEYLQGLEGVQAGGVAVTGFCFGGGMTWDTVATHEGVKAAAPYYGMVRASSMEGLATTKAAVLGVYGGNDTRITSQVDQVRAQLEQSGSPFEIQVYDGANHAFFNDTGNNYNEQAAKDAWTKTLAWFREHLEA
ncbi:MAG: dienelactone hydrolase family protein [Dehalococcoidia bacterium]|nr:dienelactone hydrolase family protein [Dehalococcoidia bacterium]